MHHQHSTAALPRPPTAHSISSAAHVCLSKHSPTTRRSTRRTTWRCSLLQWQRRAPAEQHNVVTLEQDLVEVPVSLLLLAAPTRPCADSTPGLCLQLLLLPWLLLPWLPLSWLLLLLLGALARLLLLRQRRWLLLACLRCQLLLLDALDLDYHCVGFFHVLQQQVEILVKGNKGANSPAPHPTCMPSDNVDSLLASVPLGQHGQWTHCCCVHNGGKGAQLDAGFCSLGCLQGSLLVGGSFGLLGLRLCGGARQRAEGPQVRLMAAWVVRPGGRG